MNEFVTAMIAAALLLCFALPATVSAAPEPPVPRREFRGVWIATVSNIDWPSRRDLSVEAQKAELIDLLDRAKALNLNAVIFQVRPAADALYSSELEPWSEYLTGEMGKAPEPFYDPLAFVVEEAHRRGLELHAWFNPYRGRHASGHSELAANHLGRRRPELVKTYGRQLWLDPGEPAVREHTTAVILDVVKRYDIDGVHFDDYFYPYKERDANGEVLPFPDDPSWEAYLQTGGKLSRSDWRRENVNLLVRQVYRQIKAVKPWVEFGISPFGIWRPGFPTQVRGFDAYEELYADARKWLAEGWVDYFTPQLYWKIETPGQSYPVLLNWWTQQNLQGRHLWVGQFTSRAAGGADAWPDDEITYQIRVTRGQAGATGNVHFSARGLLARDPEGLTKRLAESVYGEAALVPASPWLSATKPPMPEGLTIDVSSALSNPEATWRPGSAAGAPSVVLWVLQCRTGDAWKTAILPGSQTKFVLSVTPVDEVRVSGISRTGIQGAAARFAIQGPPHVDQKAVPPVP